MTILPVLDAAIRSQRQLDALARLAADAERTVAEPQHRPNDRETRDVILLAECVQRNAVDGQLWIHDVTIMPAARSSVIASDIAPKQDAYNRERANASEGHD